jgi:predicted NBD/HSP70 family sugar kinase
MAKELADSIVRSRKLYRRNRILEIIRSSPLVSRFDLKKITSYSMATVLSTTEELINSRLITEEEYVDAKVGRRPIPLKINPAGGYVIGIEFNNHRMHCAILDFAKDIVRSERVDVSGSDSAETIIEKIEALIERSIGSLAPGSGPVFGIGIGVPGFFDGETGVALNYPFIPSWSNIPIRQIIKDRFKLPCYIENNVMTMAYAYRSLGFNSDPGDFFFVSIRNGVRVVPYMNGDFILSRKGFAGQLGHIKVPGSNRLCSCGQHGCLNAEVSDSGIKNKMVEAVMNGKLIDLYNSVGRDIDCLSAEVLVSHSNAGDLDATAMIKDAAFQLGHCLGIVVDILAPGAIVFFGNLVKAGKPFVDSVLEGIWKNSLERNHVNLKIICSELSDSIGAYGAAAIALQSEFEYVDMQV